MTIQERIDKAMELRRQGYNCAQAVILVFPDLTNLNDETAAKISSGLGTGTGGIGELCGAANGMALCAGMRHGAAPEDKVAAMKDVGALCRQFAEGNQGRIRCCELKGKEGIRPCNDLIAQAITILHNSME